MRILLLFVAFWGVFSQTLFAQKKEQTPVAPAQKIVSGTVLLNDKIAPDAKTLLAALKKDWKLNTDSATTAEKTVVFSAQGATVMIAYLDYPVPAVDIGVAARLSWLWKNGGDEALRHQSQVVISVVGTADKTTELYKLFTKAAACVLENTNASGIYQSTQYLLLSKGFYTAAARNMRDNQSIPLYCWVYFGMASEKELSGGFTFGMQEFGMKEMEIVNSKKNLQEVHAVLYDASMTVVKNATQLQDGQSFTTIEGQKLTARLSKAAYQEGETLKLED